MAEMTIIEAAAALGVTENAIRKRIRRGSIEARKDGERWVVTVAEREDPSTADVPGHGQVDVGLERLIDELERENEFLRGQIDAKDQVVLQLLARYGDTSGELSGHLRHAIDGLIGRPRQVGDQTS